MIVEKDRNWQKILHTWYILSINLSNTKHQRVKRGKIDNPWDCTTKHPSIQEISSCQWRVMEQQSDFRDSCASGRQMVAFRCQNYCSFHAEPCALLALLLITIKHFSLISTQLPPILFFCGLKECTGMKRKHYFDNFCFRLFRNLKSHLVIKKISRKPDTQLACRISFTTI